MAEAISASERVDPGILNRSATPPSYAPAHARALRRVASKPPVEHVDGPDARIAEVLRTVTERIVSRPLTSAMLAVGVGFVVGGALSFRAGRVALAAAGRHILRELLKQVL